MHSLVRGFFVLTAVCIGVYYLLVATASVMMGFIDPAILYQCPPRTRREVDKCIVRHVGQVIGYVKVTPVTLTGEKLVMALLQQDQDWLGTLYILRFFILVFWLVGAFVGVLYLR